MFGDAHHGGVLPPRAMSLDEAARPNTRVASLLVGGAKCHALAAACAAAQNLAELRWAGQLAPLSSLQPRCAAGLTCHDSVIHAEHESAPEHVATPTKKSRQHRSDSWQQLSEGNAGQQMSEGNDEEPNAPKMAPAATAQAPP